MQTGATVSGAAHIGLIALAIFAGALFGADEAKPLQIAEVTLMTGAEFEAALSAAPTFDASAPPAPEAPKPGEERADVKLAERDSAPAAPVAPETPDAPQRGDVATPPPDAPPERPIAEVGTRLASPPAPEAGRLVAATEPQLDSAPIVEAAPPPAPAPRAAAPRVERTTPEAPPPTPPKQPTVAAAEAPAPPPDPAPVTKPEPKPVVAEAPAPAEPTPPKVAEAPTPVEETPESDEPTENAPRVMAPPPSRPKEAAEARTAERPPEQNRPPAETGATRQAAEATGGGSSRTVGRLSYRDQDALRVGIKGYFNPPAGLADERALSVTMQIEVSLDGRITKGPDEVGGDGDKRQRDALKRAAVRALKQSEAAGVYAKLPKDKYDTWKRMRVTFLPRDLELIN